MSEAIDRRVPSNDWRRSELVKGAILFFSIGMAWGTIMLSVHSVHADILSLESRTAQMEKYLISQSKGNFVPALPNGQEP